MSLKYSLFRIPGSITELTDKIKRKGIEKKVAFNVLTRDRLHSAPFYWRCKDSIRTTYYAVISSVKDPRIYFKQKLGTSLWGIQLPWNQGQGTRAEEITSEFRKIRQELENSDLEIEQAYYGSLE